MSTPVVGPSGEVPDTARHRALSVASRVRMLDLVRRAGVAITAAELVEATGLHPSTVRAHLDQLVESGLLSRHRATDGSPGRPAWRYTVVPERAGAISAGPGPVVAADQPYRDLAAALVGHLARDAEDPHAAGVRAGRDWGRALAARVGPAEPVDGLVSVLDRLGFHPGVVERPESGAAVLHLRACPFLELATGHPDVVCGVHEGVIGGALGALGASPADSRLEPFALPGACRIRLRIGPTSSPGGQP